jgi:hypothetical protein
MVMTRIILLVGGLLLADGEAAAADAALCRQPPVTVTLEERSYATLPLGDAAGGVYLYAPDIRASSAGAFEPFQLWIVEGVYGRPFVQARGPMDPGAFERLRASANIRAAAVRIGRSGEAARVAIARQPFLLWADVATSRRSDSVSVKVCPLR